MSQDLLEKKNDTPEGISLKEIFLRIHSAFRYCKSKWKIILIAAVFGAGIGLLYSLYRKPVYTALCTFVLEDSNKSGGGLGQYAGLASLAGINLGSSGGGGIFEGDNIFELYKSRLMLEKTLLSEIDFKGRKQLLIDRYIDINHLRSLWKKNDHINSINFDGDPQKFSRKQDSIITGIVLTINKGYLSVTKPDKKLNIINVEFKFGDEFFAKEFTDKLVATVNEFYVRTKTKKAAQNVAVLQKQVDSVRLVLNNSIGNVALAIDAFPNANPLFLSLKVPSQKKQIDVQANTGIYGELVKNLELSKISLRQETPLIQTIDNPVLPLNMDRAGKTKSILVGFILGAFFSMFILLIRKTYNKIMN